MNEWKAVIFDLDDTLYPERDFVLSGFRAVAAWVEGHLGVARECCYDGLRGLYEQGVRGDTFNRWLEGVELRADTVAQLVQVYREHVPQLTPFPGARELLVRLRHSWRLGLLTDGYIEVQRRKIDALALASHFDAIVFSDEWGREAWKPSTRAFEEILRRIDVAPCAAVYVADNPLKDFLGARRAGLSSIRVRYPSGEYANLTPETALHAPDHTVSSLTDIGELVR